MTDSNTRNLKILTTINSIWAVTYGLIGPFFVKHIADISGGAEKLGFAFAIMVLVQSLTTYTAGIYSDRIGRKPFLIIAAYTDCVILICYTLIDQAYQVYILQAMLGITNGVSGVVKTSFLADLTTKEKRGRNIGKFFAIIGVSSSVGLALGGFIVKLYGINILFYIAAITVSISSTYLFRIEEERQCRGENEDVIT